MESFLQKYSWAINFGLIAVAALLGALFINGFVAAQLSQFTVPKLPPMTDLEQDRPQVPTDDSDRDRWVDALADRCLFGCPEEVDPDACPEECPEGEVCEYGECVPEEIEDDQEMDNVPRLTELPLKLTGVLAAQNPRWSIAMIFDEDDQETHMAGVGDFVPHDDPVEVLEIRRDRVFIDNDGRLEFIRLEDSPYGDPQASSSGRQQTDRSDAERRREDRARRDRGSRDESSDDDDRSGVVRQDDNQYTVDRQRIESELEEPEALARQARIMPNYRDGEPDGLRLVGVTSNSFYSDLGIRSGDVIHSVNGNAINSQQEAMRMIESMGEQDQVTIEVERRGQRQEMQYNIR